MHERHNHAVSIADIQLLASVWEFPWRIYEFARLVCATCYYSEDQHKPWISKVKYSKAIPIKMRALTDEIFYIDVVNSSVPGLFPQMVGLLCSNFFHCPSFFVDYKSDFDFVYHQESTLADNVILLKRYYEVELR